MQQTLYDVWSGHGARPYVPGCIGDPSPVAKTSVSTQRDSKRRLHGEQQCSKKAKHGRSHSDAPTPGSCVYWLNACRGAHIPDDACWEDKGRDAIARVVAAFNLKEDEDGSVAAELKGQNSHEQS